MTSSPPLFLFFTATKLGSGPSLNDASSIILLGVSPRTLYRIKQSV